MRRLFRRIAQAAREPDWFALRVGEQVAAGRRGPATVAALATFEMTVDGDEGDGRGVALLWLERGGQADALMVDHDIYGGEDAFDVVTLHDLDPADPALFAALKGRLVAGEDVSVTGPGGRELVGEPEPLRLLRAEGTAAAGVPASGWAISLFRAGSKDVWSFWLVLCDRGQVPRLAFEGRSRRGGNAGYR
jgi:hypothetical protein